MSSDVSLVVSWLVVAWVSVILILGVGMVEFGTIIGVSAVEASG